MIASRLTVLAVIVGFASLAIAASGPVPVVPAVTFSDARGIVHVSARQVSKLLGIAYEYDPRSDLAFLGRIPLGHECEVAGERFIRVTVLRREGASVTRRPSGNILVTLNNRSFLAVEGKKQAVVDKSGQWMRLYQGPSLLFSTTVSTGKYTRSTPVGNFRIGTFKDAFHSSSKYGDAPMPWAVHVTRNIFIHGGHVPNYPASHGCIRLPMDAARWFFRWAEPGTIVKITN
jgi:lipoprotein-anchoring transpeptidase ErfK/SrfK